MTPEGLRTAADKALLEALPAAIYVTDPDGTIT